MRELENAVVRLLKRRPFYGYLLLGCRRVESAAAEGVGISIESGIPTLAVNPDEFSGYTAGEQGALLEHVLKHLLHLHPLRRKERSHHDWDVACDLAINPSIEHLPLAALRPERLRLEPGLAAEEYYRLIHRPMAGGNLAGGSHGNAAPDEAGRVVEPETQALVEEVQQLRPLDDHELWQGSDSTPLALAEEVVRGLVQEAARQSRGEIPGELRSLVAGWLGPAPIPWRQVLRQFVAAAGRVGRRSTWKREHRRFGHETPGVRKRQRLQLLVGIDVSDSTNQAPLREAFARELVSIARGRESRITVLYAGSRIQRIDSFRSSDVVAEVYHGGGFTDLRPVFDYAVRMQPRPAAVIYLTDGFGEAPERMEFPTLWVLTEEGQKPADWGLELRLKQ